MYKYIEIKGIGIGKLSSFSVQFQGRIEQDSYLLFLNVLKNPLNENLIY